MSAIVQAFKDADLRKKILITIALIVLYRIGAQIPTPGVDYGICLLYTSDAADE